MRLIGEYCELISLFFRASLFHLQEAFYIRRHFYRNPSFKTCDRALLNSYRDKTPFRINKEFISSKPGMQNVYGETPLSTFALIAKECSLSDNDHIIDLGCGRGRGVFFLSHFLGCKVDGVEWIPEFIEKARKVKTQKHLDNIRFFNQEFLALDLTPYSAIYLYGTCLGDEEVLSVIKRLKILKQKPKIITISYPLSDYDPESFNLLKAFPVTFPWGKTEAYLHEIR